jgi:hypothetical protein
VPLVFISHDGNDPIPNWWLPYMHPGRVARIGHGALDPLSRHRIATIIADLQGAGL